MEKEHQNGRGMSGYCSRDKSRDSCQTSQCFTYNRYAPVGLPCPYYVCQERGYQGLLTNMRERKIRRQYFNIILAISLFVFFCPLPLFWREP